MDKGDTVMSDGLGPLINFSNHHVLTFSVAGPANELTARCSVDDQSVIMEI